MTLIICWILLDHVGADWSAFLMTFLVWLVHCIVRVKRI